MAEYATIGVCGQLLADRGDPPVHHVARRDDVGAGLDVRDGRARDQLERRVVVDLPVRDDAAVAVRGVLAEADVGERAAAPESAAAAHAAPAGRCRRRSRRPSPRRPSPRGCRTGSRPCTPSADELLDLAHDAGRPCGARSAGRRSFASASGRDEERHHEVVERERSSRARGRAAARCGAAGAGG